MASASFGEIVEDPRLLGTPSRRVHVLRGAHPLDARPGKELVAGRVPARVPGFEEQAALVLIADVAREVDSGPGRDRDQAPTAQEILDPWCVFPHALLALGTLAFQRSSFSSRIRHGKGYRFQASGFRFDGRRSGTSRQWVKTCTSLLLARRSRFHGCILAAVHRPASATRPMVSGLSSMRPKAPSSSRMPSLSPVVTVRPTSGPKCAFSQGSSRGVMISGSLWVTK